MTTEEKIAQLEALLADDEPDSLGLFMLGKMYLDVGRHADAAATLERCVALKPDYSAAYRFLGDAWRKAGDAARARSTYEKGIAVAEEKGDLQASKEMGVMLRKVSEDP